MTNIRLSIVLAASVLALWAMPGTADIIVDNFNEGGVDIYVNEVSPQATDTDAGLQTTNTIGGERYSELNWQLGSDNTTLRVNQGGENLGRAAFGSQPSNDGWFRFMYGNSTDLNADMTQDGTNNRIGLLFLFNDIRGTTTVTFTTTGLGSSSLSVDNPIGGEMNTWVWFDYGAFGGSADFTDVDKIEIRGDGTPGADTIIDMVATSAIPEPSTIALLGFCGAAFLSRLRRSKAT